MQLDGSKLNCNLWQNQSSKILIWSFFFKFFNEFYADTERRFISITV